MEKRPGINMGKRDDQKPEVSVKSKAPELQEKHDAIKQICHMLEESSDTFKAERTYPLIDDYIDKHKRWLYSDVSSFLFECSEQTISTFISNLDILREYAYCRLSECDSKEDELKEKYLKIALAIDKLWDHSNLAQTQNKSMSTSDETFKANFDKNMIPYEAKFWEEMNKQFISLIAIFTALSFIAFGGISYLDNIFLGAKEIPILQLIIVGCIWSLCLCNLVFAFIYFVAKLTKLNIKSSDNEDASLSQKYPFFVWTNFFICLIFSVCCWLYFIDYANIGTWLLNLSANNSVVISIIGTFAILGIFGALAFVLIKSKAPKSRNKQQ